MIEVVLLLDSEALLRFCSVSGHAGQGPAGTDIVCAAATVLARTGLQTLLREGFRVRADAPARGVFSMDIEPDSGGREALRVVGVFLEEGFTALSREYPDHVKVDIRSEWRKQHGS